MHHTCKNCGVTVSGVLMCMECWRVALIGACAPWLLSHALHVMSLVFDYSRAWV